MQLLNCAIIFVLCGKFCVIFFQRVEAVHKVSETAAPGMTRLLLKSDLANHIIDKVSDWLFIAWSKIICVKLIVFRCVPFQGSAFANYHQRSVFWGK